MSAAKIMPNAVRVGCVPRLEGVWAVPKMATVVKTSVVMFRAVCVWMERMGRCIVRHVMIKHRAQVVCVVLALGVIIPETVA